MDRSGAGGPGAAMGDVKPWQIVLFVAAVVVVGVSLGWMVLGGEKVDLADKMYLVDVPSGDLYVVSLTGRRGITIPAMHPDTRDRTLLPIALDENGEWVISERYHNALKDMKVSPAARIDARTGAVSSVSTSAARAYKSPLAG